MPVSRGEYQGSGVQGPLWADDEACSTHRTQLSAPVATATSELLAAQGDKSKTSPKGLDAALQARSLVGSGPS